MKIEIAKHTPGPWLVHEDSYGGFNRIWSARGDDVATCMGDGSIPSGEILANERLIAAAPELLEALYCAETILILLSEEVNVLGFNAKKVLPKIKSAICKAKGFE